MTTTEIDARCERAQRALDMGIYQIEEDPSPLYDWQVSYTDRNGRPVVYHVSEHGCTCPDFVQNGTFCKHQALCQLHRERIARFEAEMDTILARLENEKAGPEKPHTIAHPLPHFWRLYLETDLTSAALKERLGDLAGKLEVSENRLKGYGCPINRDYPTKLQARQAALTEAEKADVYRRLGVERGQP